MPRMVGVVTPWDSAWICSVAGFQDLETEITMDTEETMVPEDPAATAEEPAITQINQIGRAHV